MSEKKTGKQRLYLLLSIMLGLCLVATVTPLGNMLTSNQLCATLQESGYWGIALFVALYIAASLMNIPGTPFLVFAVYLYGYALGGMITYCTALLAAMSVFLFARLVGGQVLKEIKSPYVQTLLAKAEFQPIRTLIFLRVVMQLSPLISYALGMTNMKFRHFVVGNVIAMIAPITVMTMGLFYFGERLLAMLGK